MSGSPCLLTINPNTSAEVTGWISTLVRDEAGPAARSIEITAPFGYRYLSSRVAMSIAGHAVLDAVASVLVSDARPDAILVACFGDPGIDAVAEMTGLPVTGFGHAGILAAKEQAGTSMLATRGTVWLDMLQEIALKLGATESIAGIVTIDEAGDDPAAIAALLDRKATELGAARVILGGAGLIPLVPKVMAHARFAMIDPHREAVRRILHGVDERRQPHPSAAPSDLVGLSSPLRDLLTRSAPSTSHGRAANA